MDPHLFRDAGAIKIIHYSFFESMRIGEASHPGPRLLRRGEASRDKPHGILENVQREVFVNAAHKSAQLLITSSRSHSYVARSGRQAVLTDHE